ncbi:YicC family protein [Roseococcus sp. SDR]|uniref:YicC/YloC family endoribonuclease n=1 Tax=Roseococcus sp. SDR TaxID=2835532 RepID=UPI001BCDE88D|nr:YicC/YloC family endoribonuclease [Roseococcus sp. SDR]MBS7790864.1 YicC family protein [Roseococcus sp. SDR]MBV1846178.1 YicC family protein [Roseococcus sp. SDR]
MTQRLCSMTGFAREAGLLPDGTAFAWEMKSVNGRGLELRFRLPPGLDALEGPAREAAAKRFKRGNVQIGLTLKQEGRAPLSPDMAALDRMVELAEALAARLGAEKPRAEALLGLPGIFRAEQPEPSEAEEEARRAALLAAFQRALAALWDSRAAEGARLSGILTALLDEIEALCAAAATEAATQPAAQRAKLMESLDALLGESGRARFSEDRLVQEVALLAAKSDVREELDRLGAHLAAARALVAEGEGAGRKLDFLVQEFVREANTLCSKSASVALTRIGLELKAAIERLREQAANVE